MSIRDLISWRRNDGDQIPRLFRESDRDPFLSLN
jgi:HSP20 family protein